MVLLTTWMIGLIGLLCGLALALAARFLSVYEDPRIGQVTELLPGANCGGCGYAGCADYAKAIVIQGATINLCAPGSAGVMQALSQALGIAADARERHVALVLCGGDRERAPRRSCYNGIADCAAAQTTAGGDKGCTYGCLGYGSCARVCPSGAIEMAAGQIARVHPQLCIGCGACVRRCPRKLIRMVPAAHTIHVLCSSHDKGPQVKQLCKVGCIGCGICAKLAPEGTIAMDNFLAVVDYSKPIDTPAVADKCPGKCIVNTAVAEVAA